MKKKILILLITISSCDIYDIEKAYTKKVCNNIYLINYNIPEDSGFYLIFRKNKKEDKHFFSNYEYVNSIYGNDSNLFIRTTIESNNNFYFINCSKSDSFIVNKIAIKEFESKMNLPIIFPNKN